MDVIVVPVGQDLGLQRVTDRPSYQIRRGQEIISLVPVDYLVWIAAHADPDQQARLGFTRNALVKAAAAEPFEIHDAEPVVDRLITRGLLAEYDPSQPRSFLKRHRLLPTAEGLGANDANPPRWRIGRGGEPFLEVSLGAYLLWALSHTHRSILHGCKALADEVSNEIAQAQVPIDAWAREIAAHIPPLLSTRCAVLDPVPERPTEST